MSFRIFGLQSEQYEHLVGKNDAVLAQYGAERHNVTQPNSAPCRVILDDAKVGETVILVSHPHQEASTPYRQNGPIFVSESAQAHWDKIDEVPPALARRTLSVRGYDVQGNIIEADVVEGALLPDLLTEFFEKPLVAEVHIHFARRGCFAAKAVRA
jgi:Protein of unknown function (DUF1203)